MNGGPFETFKTFFKSRLFLNRLRILQNWLNLTRNVLVSSAWVLFESRFSTLALGPKVKHLYWTHPYLTNPLSTKAHEWFLQKLADKSCRTKCLGMACDWVAYHSGEDANSLLLQIPETGVNCKLFNPFRSCVNVLSFTFRKSYLIHVGRRCRREVERFEELLFRVIFVAVTFHHDRLSWTLLTDQQHRLQINKDRT